MINGGGKIVCQELDPMANPVDVYDGIFIEPMTFGVSDPGNEGFGTFDQAELRFSFSSGPEGWIKDRAIVTPAFNIKTELQAPLV